MQDPMEMASAWEHLEGRQARADGWVIEVEDGVPKKKPPGTNQTVVLIISKSQLGCTLRFSLNLSLGLGSDRSTHRSYSQAAHLT